MKDLRMLAKNPDLRPQVIADCVTLIDQQIKTKKGLSGMAVKTAYGLVKALKPSMIEKSADSLLNAFTEQLQVYYQHYQEEGSNGSLEQYLSARASNVAESLLQITDRRASLSRNKTAVKAYNKLRPKGKEHVEIAVPEIGKLLDKHVVNLSNF
ncbi:MAG: DUF6918 family protein [Candidatus Brocadia sp.]